MQQRVRPWCIAGALHIYDAGECWVDAGSRQVDTCCAPVAGRPAGRATLWAGGPEIIINSHNNNNNNNNSNNDNDNNNNYNNKIAGNNNDNNSDE